MAMSGLQTGMGAGGIGGKWFFTHFPYQTPSFFTKIPYRKAIFTYFLYSEFDSLKSNFRQAQFRKSFYIKGFKVYTLENTLIFVGTRFVN
jgi:hypothetical protein